MTDLAKKIKTLRNEKKWTQAEFGERIGIHQMHISTYERGIYKPTADVLVRIADAFEVSLDYLLSGSAENITAKVEIKDRELLLKVEQLDRLSDEERHLAKEMIDLVITKHKMKELVKK